MDKKIKREEGKKRKVNIVLIIAVICVIDVIATLIYYYSSGAFHF